MLKATLVVLLLLSVVKSAYALSLSFPEGLSDTQEIVELKVGDVYFRIPQSYLIYSEDRAPTERKYIRIRAFEKDFRPVGTNIPLDKDSRERAEWNKTHKTITLYIIKNGEHIPGVSFMGQTPAPLSKEISFYGSPSSDEVKAKLRAFMFTEPSKNWEGYQKFITALGYTNTRVDLPTQALIPMNVIETALTSKNQWIREFAVYQLSRHKQNPKETAIKLVRIASADKEYGVRAAALRNLFQFKDFVITDTLLPRLKEESNAVVLDLLGERLRNPSTDNVVTVLSFVDEVPTSNLQPIMEVLASFIRNEIKQKDTQDYDDLSDLSKRCLAAIAEYYKRQDVASFPKAQIHGILTSNRYSFLLKNENYQKAVELIKYPPKSGVPLALPQ